MNCVKNVILICFLVAGLFSCKKKNDKLTISGVAYNTESSNNASDINVALYKRDLSNNTWNGQYTLIASQNTNLNGEFSFQFDNIRVSDYKLIFSKTGYFTSEYIINPENVKKGENYSETYNVHYESWLKLSIKNYPPSDVNDVISYRLIKGSISCTNGCADTLKYLYGQNVDTTTLCRIYGHQIVVLEWNVTNGSNHLQHIDSLLIPESDTIKHNLFY